MDESLLISPVSTSLATTTISQRFPTLKIETIKYLGGGSHSVFLVNNDLVFRFPKIVENVFTVEDSIQVFTREKHVLNLIKEPVKPITVPQQLYFSNERDAFKAPITGYPKLAGKQIKKLLRNETTDLKLAAALGKFLKKLHNLSLEELNIHFEPLSVAQLKAQWRQNYDYSRLELFSYLNNEEAKWMKKTFESFLEEADSFQPTITFVHGDFGPENVLLDEDAGCLSVLDFDDVGFSDSAVDFCVWYGRYGQGFLNEMLNSYGLVDDNFLKRVRFYYNRIPFTYFNLAKKTGMPQFVDFGKELLSVRMNKIG